VTVAASRYPQLTGFRYPPQSTPGNPTLLIRVQTGESKRHVVLTDADPEKLTDKVYRNYLERPVPRDAAP
jgi:hypothetical protein